MGNWYTNLALKNVNALEVLHRLQGLGRKAIVHPPQNGWVTVYDEECDKFDLDALESLALTLATELRCIGVPSFNADDDVLWLAVYRNGERATRYASGLSQFEDGGEFPSAKDCASVLCEVFETPERVSEVRRILERGHGVLGLLRLLKLPIQYLFEIDRHADLARALGMPTAAIGLGFTYIARGETAEGTDGAGLLHT